LCQGEERTTPTTNVISRPATKEKPALGTRRTVFRGAPPGPIMPREKPNLLGAGKTDTWVRQHSRKKTTVTTLEKATGPQMWTSTHRGCSPQADPSQGNGGRSRKKKTNPTSPHHSTKIGKVDQRQRSFPKKETKLGEQLGQHLCTDERILTKETENDVLRALGTSTAKKIILKRGENEVLSKKKLRCRPEPGGLRHPPRKKGGST